MKKYIFALALILVCAGILAKPVDSVRAEDAARVHGVNERIRIQDLTSMVHFFIRLVRLWGEAGF